MHKYLFGLLLIAISFASCNSTSHQGPCEYFEFKAVKFKVVSITPIKGEKDNFDIWIEFEESSLADGKKNFRELKEIEKTDINFINDNKIKEGKIYNCDISELKPGTGNCEPLIIGWNNKFRVR